MHNIETLRSKPSGDTDHVDVLIVGAGISGIGAAHHLQEQCPDKSFVILETKESFGGTWRQHTYPGIRSDSDLYTFGYRFKPWTGKPVAEADAILDYLEESIEDAHIDAHIRYQHEVLSASWSIGKSTIGILISFPQYPTGSITSLAESIGSKRILVPPI